MKGTQETLIQKKLGSYSQALAIKLLANPLSLKLLDEPVSKKERDRVLSSPFTVAATRRGLDLREF